MKGDFVVGSAGPMPDRHPVEPMLLETYQVGILFQARF